RVLPRSMPMADFIDFIRTALRFRQPDHDAVQQAGDDASRQVATYKAIVRFTGAVAGVCVLAGIILAALHWQTAEDRAFVVCLPIMGLFCGSLVGVSLALLFAPREFLLSPVGRKWLGLIGVRNILVARVVCVITLLFFSILPVLLVLGKL